MTTKLGNKNRLQELRRERLELDEEIDKVYKAIRQHQEQGTKGKGGGAKAKEELTALEAKLRAMEAAGEGLDETIKAACLDYHFKFHPVWGKLFEAGFQESRFAKQVRLFFLALSLCVRV